MRRVVTLTFIFVFLWTTAESEIDPKLQALCEGDSALAKLNDMLLRTRIEVQKGAPVLAGLCIDTYPARSGRIHCSASSA